MPRFRAAAFAAVLALPWVAAAPAAAGEKISPALTRAFAASADGRAEMLVVLAEQADLTPAAALPTKAAKGRFVFERLSETAERTQGPLLAELARRGAPSRPFWAANFVWTKGDLSLAQALAAREDVARLETNPRLVLTEPVEDPEAALLPDSPDAIEWNISKVNAPQVWALGHTGAGAVIAGEDTGYQWDHPALKTKYRGWNGAVANHNYNWHDAIHAGGSSCGADSPVPCDDTDHGTHTMGTMVGDDGGGNQVGMAPGARWIGCRNMNAGAGTPTTYIECFQWFIAPTDLANQNPDPAMAPDVINNSWGCPASEGCNPGNFAVMQAVVENVRAAGIFVAVSAGNDGSGCSTVNTPAAIYDAVFSVGSTESSDAISSFSSRGPVTVDGSNRMKPDISAPGGSVRSALPGGGYGTKSGTSMAGPHVAGLVGLLVSAAPGAAGNIDLLEDVIRQSAVHPTFGGACGVSAGVYPNNTFGAGRIDALAAVNLLLSQAFFAAVTPPAQAVCAPTSAVFNVAVGQLGSFTEPVTLSATGNPAGSTVGFATNPVTPPGGSTMTVTTVGVAAGPSTITVTGTASPSGTLHTDTVELTVFTAGAAAPGLTAPADGATNVPVRPGFSWAAAAGAASYLLEVDDGLDFATPIYSASVSGTSHTPGVDLPSNTPLHWRVTASNPCAAGVSAVRGFTTVPLPGDCASGTVASAVYEFGFESGAGGWTASGTGSTWAQSGARFHSGGFSYKATDSGAVSDQRLVSPAVVLPTGQGPLTLQFWNHQTMEANGAAACYDGAILEISTNGGSTWTQLTGAALQTDPYNGAVSACCSNPLAGLQAWCGDPQDWTRSIVDIDAFAGQTVSFRFRLGSDTSVSREGWYLDDVRVQSCAGGAPIFTDGFESGNASSWSAVVP